MKTTWHTDDEKLKARVNRINAARRAIMANDFSGLSKSELETAMRLIKENPFKK